MSRKFVESDAERSDSDANSMEDETVSYDDEDDVEETASNTEEEEVEDEERELMEKSKKRRLEAHEYLRSLKASLSADSINKREEETTEVDASEIDKETIALRLRQDVQQLRGKAFRRVASQYRTASLGQVHFLKADAQTPTCVAFTPDGNMLFAGSKSGNISQWRVSDRSLVHLFAHSNRPKGRRTKKTQQTKEVAKDSSSEKGHRGHILCLAVSPNGQYLVSGGQDAKIKVWDIATHQLLQTFGAHRGAITGLAFQLGTLSLFSSSLDRTVKLWDLSQLAYVDTFFGHQDAALAVDALAAERCITTGARDRTARLWKITEESQLIFRALDEAGGSLDTIAMIDADHFVTGSDNGALSVWGTHKKKPLATALEAHHGPIVALSALRLTDLVASGSQDGHLCLWHVDADNYRTIECIRKVPLSGYINSIAFNEQGSLLAVALGRDPRLGRWSVLKSGVRNRIALIPIDLDGETANC